MDTSIEREFFRFYEFGGVVGDCIQQIRDIYNLPKTGGKEIDVRSPWEISDIEEEAPADVLVEAGSFDTIVEHSLWSGALMDEIAANLSEVKGDEIEKERYLLSLLKPFAWDFFLGESIGGIFVPTGIINRHCKIIESLKKDIAKYKAMPADTRLTKENYAPLDMMNICNDGVKTAKEEMAWIEEVRSEFKWIVGCHHWAPTKIESCFKTFYDAYVYFANNLDALLLSYGIDLMELQKISGYYLIEEHDTNALADIFYSNDRVEYYINRLPKPQPQVGDKEYSLPTRLDIGKARKYINRAIEKGWIEINGNSGKWLFGGVTRLAYFCLRAFAQPRPINDLERFFDGKGLAGMISNIENEDKDKKLRNDVREWRKQIDALFSD